jgi:hypothetical protein
MAGAREFPKTLWCLWLQGWNSAPDVAQACLASWQQLNPGWRVHALDEESIRDFLPADALERICAAKEHPEALSDYIRIELLYRHGGVWADATTMCMESLDEWLPASMQSGFFAFEKPTTDRMIASWFLAAEKGSYIVEQWWRSVVEFWDGRTHRGDDYFWFHQLFANNLQSDPNFRAAWSATKVRPASPEGHFAPFDPRLIQPATAAQVAMLREPPSPVFKLSHKIPAKRSPNSLVEVLCRDVCQNVTFAPTASKRVLLAWYGSFDGHGTIGDLRSLECVGSHLAAGGHQVSHASAHNVSIAGTDRIQWRIADTSAFDAVVFVCGPILNFHPETNALFRHFRSARLAGLGVSLLPEDHAHFANPFDTVFARQGCAQTFGDVAILAPTNYFRVQRSTNKCVALVLRGPQFDYGEAQCAWQRTEDVCLQLAEFAAADRDCKVITIENHLARSGRTADQIDALYAGCDLVITSRFHGAIAAMRHGVPFIAIDQIRGGAKVYDLLVGTGWPFVYKIDEIDDLDLCSIISDLRRDDHQSTLFEARTEVVRGANKTLAGLDRWLATLP